MAYHFSKDDWKHVREFLRKLERESGRRWRLADLLKEWEAFVLEVEQGYKLGIEDYTNDLATRDLLQEIIQSLSHEGQASLKQLIEPMDARLLKATRPVDRPLLPPLGDESLGFWWYRIPKKAGEDLLTDLSREGFV